MRRLHVFFPVYTRRDQIKLKASVCFPGGDDEEDADLAAAIALSLQAEAGSAPAAPAADNDDFELRPVPDEPTMGNEAVKLQLQLPGGDKVTRRFAISDTIGGVVDYVMVHPTCLFFMYTALILRHFLRRSRILIGSVPQRKLILTLSLSAGGVPSTWQQNITEEDHPLEYLPKARASRHDPGSPGLRAQGLRSTARRP